MMLLKTSTYARACMKVCAPRVHAVLVLTWCPMPCQALAIFKPMGCI